MSETLGFFGFLGTVAHFLHIGLGARPAFLVFLGTVTHFEHIGVVFFWVQSHTLSISVLFFLGTVTHFEYIGVVFLGTVTRCPLV